MQKVGNGSGVRSRLRCVILLRRSITQHQRRLLLCCDRPHEHASVAMHADGRTLTHDRSHADRAGSSDKAEVFHQFALAIQDLMVLFGHHHCQHEYRNYKAQADCTIWHQDGNLHAIWHNTTSLLTFAWQHCCEYAVTSAMAGAHLLRHRRTSEHTLKTARESCFSCDCVSAR